MHPADEIYCEKSTRLKGKTIVFGITGSVAASECFATIREFIRHGAKVIPVLTESAQKFVTPLMMEYASGVKPITELTGQTEHVNLMGRASNNILIIYPATANTISKIANGIDDTTVTSMATVALGSKVPILIAPAMHDAMFRNPAVKKNIETLKKYGVIFVGPNIIGERAKVVSKEEVISSTLRILSDDKLSRKKILVIGGRSEEPIDEMRIITNRSTGIMAMSIATHAEERGADVELWMGGCSVQIPDYINIKRFESVDNLIEMVKTINHDIVIVPAALSDFTPAVKKKGKISSDDAIDLKLEPVKKVLPIIAKKCKFVVGFKAESGLTKEELIKKARQRMKDYSLSAIVANDISVSGKARSSVVIVSKDNEIEIEGTKDKIADAILDYCSENA